MKKPIFLLLTCLVYLCSYSQTLTKIKPLTTKGFYTNPIVSPKGDYVLLTKEHFNGVYLFDFKTLKITQISKISGSGYGYSWSNDGESIYFKEKKENDYVSNSEVKVYNKKRKVITKLDINHNYLPSFQGNTKENNIVIYTNINTLKIEAKDLNTNKTWIVTKDDGQFYNAILSHDKTKVAVHNGADIYIYHIDGSGLIVKLGPGIVTSWSKDDQYLIGFLDESKNGHETSNADLYLFEVKTSKTTKITTTENIFEMFPSFYDTNKIIYADDKAGQIFTATIKF